MPSSIWFGLLTVIWMTSMIIRILATYYSVSHYSTINLNIAIQICSTMFFIKGIFTITKEHRIFDDDTIIF